MQTVHYPLLPYVDASRWSAFSAKRRMLTMMVIYPLMAFETLTGVALILIATQSKSYGLLVASIVILIALLIYTVAYLNPQFKKISSPDDEISQQRFLKLHWVRTIGWTVRLLLFVLILLAAGQQ
jgi:hypothetical protein